MSYITNLIRTYPLIAMTVLSLCWGTWSVACRKSGLSKDWVNMVTIFLPAVIFLFSLNKIHFEKPQGFSSWFWIVFAACTYTLSIFLMRGFINSPELQISSYIPTAQTIVPIAVTFFSYLILGEEISSKKILGLCIACIGIYIMIKKT